MLSKPGPKAIAIVANKLTFSGTTNMIQGGPLFSVTTSQEASTPSEAKHLLTRHDSNTTANANHHSDLDAKSKFHAKPFDTH